MPTPTNNQIEDIYATVEKTPKNQNLGGNVLYRNPALETLGPMTPVAAPTKKKIWFIIGLVLVVVILCGVIYVMIKQFGLFQKTPTDAPVIPYPEVKQEEVVVPPEQIVDIQSDTPVIDDADSDGLSLEEETALKTNPNKQDTDNDGLSDYDEAKMFLTDPLNPDTDGDSYLDGAEVAGGYNPNGAGQLLNFESALKDLNTKQ